MRQSEIALRKTAEEAQAQLLASNREATAAMAATQTRLDGLKDEIAQARLDIKTAQGDRDENLQRVVALTDQLHQTEDARRRLTERSLERKLVNLFDTAFSRRSGGWAENFEDAGVLTGNRGVVISVGNGQEFQLTIVESKRR